MIKSYLGALLQKGKREDARGLYSYRDIQIEFNPIKRANGSARVKLGETEVLVGVKMDVGEPFPDSPEDGVLIVNTELSPLASPDFEPGPPRENAIEMARIVDRSIRESKTLDFNKLFIAKKKVWIVFIDVYPMNDAGNLYDAAVLGAIIALKNAVFPKYDKENEKVLYNELTENKLPVTKTPILTTFAKINDIIFVDPTTRELEAMDTRLSIATLENGDVCAMQKGEIGTFTDKEVIELVEKSVELSKKLRKYVK